MNPLPPVTGFDVGPLRIDPPTALAPMEGITDRPFRNLIRSLGGCGLTVTEFIRSDQLAKHDKRAWATAELDPDEHPVSIQIYGRDPASMAAAAIQCQEIGADIVDLNLGCPSKRVTGGCSGSALMREPELARAMFEAVAAAVDIPMTVKMRLGWDHEALNAPLVARMAEDAGARMVAVHGRTRMQMYTGVADWRRVRETVEAVRIPVLVNGDVLTVDDGLRALAESGAAGVMIGRGSMRDPWIFRRISDRLAGRTPYRPPLTDREAVLLRYFEMIRTDAEQTAQTDRRKRVDPIKRAVGRMKKVTGYFTRGLPYGAELRQTIFHTFEVAPIYDAVRGYFARLTAERIDDGFARVHDDGEQTYADGDDRTLQRAS